LVEGLGLGPLDLRKPGLAAWHTRISSKHNKIKQGRKRPKLTLDRHEMLKLHRHTVNREI